MTSHINVALLGSKFMGRAHSNAWLNVGKFFAVDPLPTMHTVVARNDGELGEFAERWGWQHHTTDWHAAVTSDDIGLVDIGTPNNVHAEQAIAALEAGKHVACEKPLAGTLSDARAMVAAAARGSRHDVGLVQLPAGAGRRPGTPSGGRRQDRSDLPRACRLPAELGRPGHATAVAIPGRHRRLRCPRRPQRPHHRLGQVRHRRGDRHRRGRDRAHVHRGACRPRRRDGWRDRRRRRQHHGQQGGEHRRRRRAVPRPAERRRSRQLRSHPPRDRISQRQPLRDPR